MFESRQPARVDHLDAEASAVTALARQSGARSSAGAPIEVEGQLWGAMIVASVHEAVLPQGTEHELAAFTELIATAIANAEARAELSASRARLELRAADADNAPVSSVATSTAPPAARIRRRRRPGRWAA